MSRFTLVLYKDKFVNSSEYPALMEAYNKSQVRKKSFDLAKKLRFHLALLFNSEAAYLWKKAKHYENELYSSSEEKLGGPGFWSESTDRETDKLYILGEKEYPKLNQRLMGWIPDQKCRTRTVTVDKVNFLKGFTYKDLCAQRMGTYRTQVYSLVRTSLPALPKSNRHGKSLF